MTDSESHTPTVSLLERLKAPKHSDLTQKSAVGLSPPPKGKKGLDILRIIADVQFSSVHFDVTTQECCISNAEEVFMHVLGPITGGW